MQQKASEKKNNVRNIEMGHCRTEKVSGKKGEKKKKPKPQGNILEKRLDSSTMSTSPELVSMERVIQPPLVHLSLALLRTNVMTTLVRDLRGHRLMARLVAFMVRHLRRGLL